MSQFANCLMMLGMGGDRQLTERWISAPSDYAPKVDVGGQECGKRSLDAYFHHIAAQICLIRKVAL